MSSADRRGAHMRVGRPRSACSSWLLLLGAAHRPAGASTVAPATTPAPSAPVEPQPAPAAPSQPLPGGDGQGFDRDHDGGVPHDDHGFDGDGGSPGGGAATAPAPSTGGGSQT